MRWIVFCFFLVLAVCVIASCSKDGVPAQGVKTSTNENFEVVFLFEIEGVKIYRFIDAGHFRYFATGKGSYLPSMQSTNTGKTTTYHSDGAEQ